MFKSKKKILVIATSRKTRGGITSVINAHARGNQWSEYKIKWLGTHIDRNVFMKLFYFVRSWIQFIFLVPFYDLIHFHVSTRSSVFRKCFYLFFAKLFNKKVISHLHCSTPAIIYEPRNRRLYRYLFLRSDLVLVLSNQWKRYVKEALDVEDNVRILYNPIMKTSYITTPVERKKYVLFAGTIDKRKGYHDLLRAFQKVLKTHSDWSLILAGNGEVEEGKALAETLDIKDQVDFRGWVSGEKKELLFKEASIFCLPSYAEGFPMSVLDAWAYCLPVVCTPVGGIPDIAEDGKNILLFEAGDIDMLVSQINKYIDNPDLRKSIAEQSHQLSETVFNLENINSQLENIYKELLGDKCCQY